MKKMKAIRSTGAKPTTTKNAWFEDANGQEIIFPELEEGDSYSVGDKVELESDRNPTFETVMPDGSTIIVKDGILDEIIEPAEEEKAQKVFNCSLTSSTVEIFGDHPAGPFVVGNRVKANGKENISLGRFQSGNIEIFVSNGKIKTVKNVQKLKARNLFKRRI